MGLVLELLIHWNVLVIEMLSKSPKQDASGEFSSREDLALEWNQTNKFFLLHPQNR